MKDCQGKVERDGELIKAIDELAAFIEAYLALDNGIQNESLNRARQEVKDKYKSKVISNVDFGQIYNDFNK